MAVKATNQTIKVETQKTKKKPASNKNAKNNSPTTTKRVVNKEKETKVRELIKKVAKIEKLPKNVRESIPITTVYENGVIETYPGTFTKSYKLTDINFSIAPLEEQERIYKEFMNLLNSFGPKVKWQINLFNHEIDKHTTIKNIRVAPRNDGLNSYRQELNKIYLTNLKEGNNSITCEKYLTISTEDTSVDHVNVVFNRLDIATAKNIRKIIGIEAKPMTAKERINLLYSIYNQDEDYRVASGIYDDDKFNMKVVQKIGLSIKDIIGPSSFDFTKKNQFMINDTYARVLYLEKVPTFLNTGFINELTEIQNNMLISVSAEMIESEKTIKMVRQNLASIEGKASAIQKRNSENGIFAQLPPDLEEAQNHARELMSDITSRNQNAFYLTFTIVVFARTQEQLDEATKSIISIAGGYICPLKPLGYQQEFAFNTSLPLCRDDIKVEMLYTTESAAIFIPFNSQELMEKNSIFYGLNQTTKNMVMYDRTKGENYNGLIFGSSGSGKSFTAKLEMISVLLNHADAQIFVIDPQGEYYPLVNALNGEEIKIAPGSNVRINPLDLDISLSDEDDSDPITAKSDFVISMFDIIAGKNRQLQPEQNSILDRCTRQIYKAYLDELERNDKTFLVNKCPTLLDLYEELSIIGKENYAAKQLADMLYQYARGSFKVFSGRTNVNTRNRFVCYNTKKLGSGANMKELGLFVCLNDVWNRMITNSKRHVYTWAYIDEFHLLLESDGSTVFLKRIWKMARKWLGVPTGIMQNTEDLLRNADTRNIVNNTSFVIMLNAPLMDRQNLAELFSLSPNQLEYIHHPEKGHGLLFNGKITIPFGYNFPKNTELYKVLTTSHDVEGANFG